MDKKKQVSLLPPLQHANSKVGLASITTPAFPDRMYVHRSGSQKFRSVLTSETKINREIVQARFFAAVFETFIVVQVKENAKLFPIKTRP